MDKLLAVPALFLGAIALSFLMAYPVMWMWNYNTTLLHLPEMDVMHAWALSMLCSMLFKSSSSSSK